MGQRASGCLQGIAQRATEPGRVVSLRARCQHGWRVVRLWWIVWLGCCAVTSWHAAAVALEIVPERDLAPTGLLRWDRVAGPPHWAGGEEPRSGLGPADPLFCLAPGQSTTLHVAAGSMLRLRPCEEVLSPEDLAAWVSDGGGLAVATPWAVGSTDGSLVLPTHPDTAVWVRIERPVQGACSRSFRAYVSRRVVAESVEGQCVLPGTTCPEPLCINGRPTREAYGRLQAGDSVVLRVSGLSTIRLQCRFLYSEHESRADQAVQIRIRGDDERETLWEMETGPERDQMVSWRGRPQRVSGLAERVLVLPPGADHLRIETSGTVLMSITGHAERRSPAVALPSHVDTPLAGSLWQITRPTGAFDGGLSLQEHWQYALRAARDNRFAAGGLSGWAAMRALSLQRPGQPEADAMAFRLRAAYTRSLPLLPGFSNESISIQPAYYATARLVAPGQTRREPIVSDTLLQDTLGDLSLGSFIDLAPGQTVRYQLPPRGAHGLLRVAAEYPAVAPIRLSLRGDQGAELRLAAHHGTIPPTRLTEPPASVIALGLLRDDDDMLPGHPLGAQFSRFRSPADWLATVSANIECPAHWETVVLRNDGDTPARVSIHVLASRVARLSESNWRALRGTLPDHPLSALLLSTDEPPLDEHGAVAELRNHYHPLRQRLAAQFQRFTRGLELTTRLPVDSKNSPLSARQALTEARAAAQNEDWLEVLRLTTRCIDGSAHDSRRAAMMLRLEALAAVEENPLWEQELRRWLVADEDPVVQRIAFQKLAEHYERQDNAAQLLALVAARVHTDPSPVALAACAEQLASQGDWEDALDVSLLLAADQRPLEATLLAAHRCGWWATFHDTLGDARLTDEQRHWWLGWEQVARQGLPAAEAHWKRAGAAGHDLLQSIAQGRKILADLQSGQLTHDASPLRDWGAWLESCPGPRVWQPDASVIAQSRGTARLMTDNSASGMVMHRATPEQPITMVVQGPTTVHLEARALEFSAELPPATWLTVELDDKLLARPLDRLQLSDTLQMWENPHVAVGRATTIPLTLAAGRHVIRLRPNQGEVLLRALTLQPAIPLGLLPPLHPSTVDALLGARPCTTRWGTASVPDPAEALRYWRLSGIGSTPCVQSGCFRYPEEAGFYSHDFAEPPPQRKDAESSAAFREQIQRLAADRQQDPAERALLLLYLWDLHTGDPRASIDNAHQGDQLLNAVRLAMQVADVEYRERLLEMIAARGRWTGQRDVASSAGILPVESPWPSAPSFGALVRYALSAGARDPAATNGSVHLLSGYRELNFRRRAAEPTTLLLECAQPRILSQPAMPLQVEVHDGTTAHHLPLESPDEPATIRVVFPAGIHTVRVRLLTPYAGGLATVHAYEESATGERQPWSGDDRTDTTPRDYFAATAQQPVILETSQPAWFRIEQLSGKARRIWHEWREADELLELPATGRTPLTLYRIERFVTTRDVPQLPIYRPALASTPVAERWLPSEWNDILLTDAGTAGAIDVSRQRVSLSSATVPVESLLTHARHDVPALLPDIDPFPLSGDSLGTWGLAGGLFQRRAVEEGRLGGGDDSFAQGLLSYDRFDPFQRSYVHQDGVLRMREGSGPTIGYRHERWEPLANVVERLFPEWVADSTGPCRPWYDDCQTNVEGYGYLQWPSDTRASLDERTEGSLGGRARLYRRVDVSESVYHLPSIAFSARWLSMDRNRYLPGRVDQDIFTPFKATHRIGFLLSDTWAITPTETRRFFARPSLVTNEDLNPVRPDHVAVQVGWAELYGSIDLELAYRYAHFLADDDRATGSDQHLLYGDLTLDRWVHAGLRYELDLSVRHVLDEGETSAYIMLTRFRSQGRGYRDIHPNEIGFRQERERRAFWRWWNAE